MAAELKALLRELRQHIVFDHEGDLTCAEFDAMLARADAVLAPPVDPNKAAWLALRKHDGQCGCDNCWQRYTASHGVAPCEPEPRMAFCPACFAAVTPEQADAPNVVRFSEQAAAVLAALVTGSAEVEYTTRPDGFWLTADNPSDLARALHDSPDALFRIAPAADEGGNDGR